MRRILVIAAAALIGAAAAFGLAPATAHAADQIDEKRVMEIVEKMLQERPEIIVDALAAYQAKQEQAEQERQKEMLVSSQRELFDRPGDPFIGNPKGSITIVEFFDYRCGYCKRVLKDVVEITQANPDVKVVFKEFPILGDQSVIASRVSLAVNQVAPAKYGEFHKKVMTGRGTYDKASLLRVAAALGIDPASVDALIEDKAVSASIRDTYQLAEQLGIRGTPAFVIGDQVIPGAVDKGTLQRLIDEQRG